MSTRRVLGLVERLLDEPRSRYRAKIIGGRQWREHIGWGPGEYLQAALIDAVNANTVTTAYHGSKSRPPRIEPTYRPPFAPSEFASLDEVPFEQIEALINN